MATFARSFPKDFVWGAATASYQIEGAHDDEPNPLGHYYETKIAFQVWDAGGNLLVRSALAPSNMSRVSGITCSNCRSSGAMSESA